MKKTFKAQRRGLPQPRPFPSGLSSSKKAGTESKKIRNGNGKGKKMKIEELSKIDSEQKTLKKVNGNPKILENFQAYMFGGEAGIRRIYDYTGAVFEAFYGERKIDDDLQKILGIRDGEFVEIVGRMDDYHCGKIFTVTGRAYGRGYVWTGNGSVADKFTIDFN